MSNKTLWTPAGGSQLRRTSNILERPKIRLALFSQQFSGGDRISNTDDGIATGAHTLSSCISGSCSSCTSGHGPISKIPFWKNQRKLQDTSILIQFLKTEFRGVNFDKSTRNHMLKIWGSLCGNLSFVWNAGNCVLIRNSICLPHYFHLIYIIQWCPIDKAGKNACQRIIPGRPRGRLSADRQFSQDKGSIFDKFQS